MEVKKNKLSTSDSLKMGEGDGNPQGSILGHLLFRLYIIDDLSNFVKNKS
jgi:hypothetical protein